MARGTDRHGGEISGGRVIDESLAVLRAFTRLPRGVTGAKVHYTLFRFWPTDCSNESRINTAERYKTFTQSMKCVRLRPDRRLGGLFRLV